MKTGSGKLHMSLDRYPEPSLSHSSRWNQAVLKDAGIETLEHIRNSLDMNAIEQAWMPMRISVTKTCNRPHTLE